MRVLRIALVLVAIVVKRRLAYRGDLLVQGLDEVLRGLLALVLLHVYASKSQDLAGYTGDQLLFVVGFSLVVVALFHCLCGNLYQLSSRYLIDGNLDRVLLRPYPVFLQICFDRLGIEDLSGAILGLSVMAVAAARIPGFAWDPGHLLLLAVMMASAFAVVVAVFMAFAATGFWFEDRIGMVPPVYNLMEFGRWPTQIYHPALQILITCAIPFAFVAWYPASLFVGGPAPDWPFHPGLLTPVVGAVSLGLALLVWRAGLARYNSAGS
ncbi:ABC transporter permease [Planctomycetota bacterium]|nr:ABC transporter permease [Planctomycetota bacterium]